MYFELWARKVNMYQDWVDVDMDCEVLKLADFCAHTHCTRVPLSSTSTTCEEAKSAKIMLSSQVVDVSNVTVMHAQYVFCDVVCDIGMCQST